MTWCATGPTPDVAPTAPTPDPETAMEWARNRARFYGLALVWVLVDGAPVVVAEVRPDVGPDGDP